ncbi:MAG: two-component system sensor histidine kinase CreC, partial [Akkermansiaceae bacterium]|nr:two-component system sensor histidine kinase CreC [Akkermansiaceae bacterium]
TEYAHAVRRGERVALPKLGSPDLRTLGRALDEMRDSLEDRKYVQSYVQTLTHEMKSPVSAIRGAAELLREDEMPPGQRDRFLANISTETERLQNIIDRLLALSAIESRKNLENPAVIELTELIDEICASHQHAFEARGMVLERNYHDSPKVRGEAFLLEIAVG